MKEEEQTMSSWRDDNNIRFAYTWRSDLQNPWLATKGRMRSNPSATLIPILKTGVGYYVPFIYFYVLEVIKSIEKVVRFLLLINQKKSY